MAMQESSILRIRRNPGRAQASQGGRCHAHLRSISATRSAKNASTEPIT